MNSSKKIWSTLTLTALLLFIGGCATLVEEDPNSQQTPWGTPANWEGQVPGMPTSR